MQNRLKRRTQKFDIAIIGGGFTGASVAAQLLRHANPAVSVVVIEKAGLPGRGLAYGTDCGSHLLNVPAKEMSAFPEEPEHFLRWAKSNCNREVGACTFLPRQEYGRYLGSILSHAISSSDDRRLSWKQDEARTLSRTSDGDVEIRLRSGGRILADRVILALGNFPSSDPPLPGRAPANHSGDTSSPYFSNPWAEATFDGVRNLESILLLGSGLSSIDVALKLRDQGFTGTIHVLSRHGLLPQSHKTHSPWPTFWNASSAKNLRGLLRLVREQVRRAERQGGDWRGVINSLREVTPRIWRSLPLAEKRRFLRHVRPYWEAHRHRAAPEVAQFVSGEMSAGQLQLHAGRVEDYREIEAKVEITYRERKSGKALCLLVDRVVNCTAPETDCGRLQDPLLVSLLATGLARPDPLFLGLDTTIEGALIARDGNTSGCLYAIGAARKGSLWESTAVPEIRDQVYQLVQYLVNDLPSTHRSNHDARHWLAIRQA
jgi:uncharacterized NAD(P)/FAD-binding protein YdhS